MKNKDFYSKPIISLNYVIKDQSVEDIFKKSLIWINSISDKVYSIDHPKSIMALIKDQINTLSINGNPLTIRLGEFDAHMNFEQIKNDVEISISCYKDKNLDFFNIKEFSILQYIEDYFQEIVPADKYVLKVIYSKDMFLENITRERNLYLIFLVFISVIFISLICVYKNMFLNLILILSYILIAVDQKKYFTNWKKKYETLKI